MRRYGDLESFRAQVCDMAQKIHRRLRIAILELAVGRTHAAHGLDLTGRTLGDAGDLLPPHRFQKMIPAFAEAPPAQVEGIEVGKHANAHFSFGIDGEAVNPSAALVYLVAVFGRSGSVESPCKLLPLSHPLRILEIHFHDLPRLEPYAYWTPRTVNAGTDHAVELEPHTQPLGKCLHLSDFVLI